MFLLFDQYHDNWNEIVRWKIVAVSDIFKNICINYTEESCKHRFEVMFNQDLQLEIGNKKIWLN